MHWKTLRGFPGSLITDSVGTLIKYIAYYGFLAILSVTAGVALPLILFMGAAGILSQDYLKGGGLIMLALAGNYLCFRAFEYRKRLSRKAEPPSKRES